MEMKGMRQAKRLAALGVAWLGMTGLAWGQWTGTNPVTTTSNVGIGVTNPTGRLSIGYDTSGILNLGIGNLGISGGNSAGNLHIESPASMYLNYYSNGWILMGNGKVGIGTPAPEVKLTVNGESWEGGLLLKGGDGGTGVPIHASSDKDYNWGYNSIFSDANGSLSLQAKWNAGSKNMVLQPHSGNVGIGTVNPAYKLSVNGTVQAKEVLVNTGWADHVFRPQYKLKSLGEVASYIREKGHLPGIPSGAEVKEKGVGLGEMQVKLLEKIEELTLHMIAAEERGRTLEESRIRLEKENRDLRECVAALAARVEGGRP